MKIFQCLYIREHILIYQLKRMRNTPFFLALASVTDNFSGSSSRQIIALRDKLLRVNSRIGNASFGIANMTELLSGENHKVGELLAMSDDDLAELILSYCDC